jgi:hypothetical protein
MTTDNITLTPVTAATANAAAQVILNRVDTQIRRLNNAWSGGWDNLKLTLNDITTTHTVAYQNIEVLGFFGVITPEAQSQLRTQLYGAHRDALRRRDTFKANKAQAASDRQLIENAKTQAEANASPLNVKFPTF